MLVGPVPGMLQELLTRQVVLLDALLRKFLHHLCLGSNRSVVGARHPTGILALHAGTTHQDVLNGVVEHVAHVEHTSHIGGRDDDCIGFATIRFRTEKFVIQPILIPFAFDLVWVVFTCNFHTFFYAFFLQRAKVQKKLRKEKGFLDFFR